jgi:hypothetical protein
MQYRFINENIKYDGLQLRSHWIFENTGLLGDAIVAFSGPADVPSKNLVDLVDAAAKSKILSPLMLHFIAEHFGSTLSEAILKQRLLCAIAAEELTRKLRSHDVERRGNDLYDGDKKLSVSIATVSPISCLIHFGINIRTEGTPLPTKGLAEYNIDPIGFADTIMRKYADEMKSASAAGHKVRPVP